MCALLSFVVVVAAAGGVETATYHRRYYYLPQYYIPSVHFRTLPPSAGSLVSFAAKPVRGRKMQRLGQSSAAVNDARFGLISVGGDV
jgi:hypothetical protein